LRVAGEQDFLRPRALRRGVAIIRDSPAYQSLLAG